MDLLDKKLELRFVLDRTESAWRKHRHPADRLSFAAARIRIAGAVHLGRAKVVETSYFQDGQEVCPKCKDEEPSRLCGAEKMIEILGYC